MGIQCAGNRRNQLNEIQNVKGLVWRGGSIGNATWTGVWLRDVLLDAGYDPSHGDASQQHCQFVGLDNDGTEGSNYGASIPLRKAVDEYGDVLLAFQMNGEELAPDHGSHRQLPQAFQCRDPSDSLGGEVYDTHTSLLC